MKKNLINTFQKFIMALFVVLMMGMIISNFHNRISYVIPFIASIIIIIYSGKLLKQDFYMKNRTKTMFLIITCAILIRLALLFLDYNNPMGDYAVYYENAVSLSNNQSLSITYISLFPHLFGYIQVLSWMMNIFGTSYTTVVLLNIIFDLLTMFIIFKTIRNQESKLKGTFLWAINPINIMWCAMSVPISALNLFLALSIWIFSKINLAIKKRHYTTLSILLGISLFITNIFRPLMPIFIIAIAICYGYKLLLKYTREELIKSSICLILTITSFTAFNNLNMQYIEKKLKTNVAAGAPGYTLYTGASLESSGSWNPKISQELYDIYDKYQDSDETQKYFTKKSILTYKENGIKNNTKLFAKKFLFLTKDLSIYSNDNFAYQVNSAKIRNINGIIMITEIIFTIILGTCLLFGVNNLKGNKIKTEAMLIVLFIIGFIIASLLLEVSPRYVLSLLVPLTIIASLNTKLKRVE